MIRRMNVMALVLGLLVLVACSQDDGTEQVVISSLSTQVSDALRSTGAVRTENAESTRQAELAGTTTRSSTATEEPTSTDIPTGTSTLSPTEVATLTATGTTTPSETPTNTPVPWGFIPDNAIVFYLTSIGTGGPVGCGDSLIKLSTGQVKTGDLPTDLKIALDAVFNTAQNVGGLYNATYPSLLKVSQVDFNASSGVAEVVLSGSYQKPRDGCDASRYRAQVWTTALQFDEITRFIPWVGGSLLGDRLAVYSDSGK
jgi:hypothetical protein